MSRIEGAKKVIEIIGLNKWFGPFHVLKDVDLTVREQEIYVVCGPSGSGKSTLIRCINQLEHHQEGDIVVDGIAVEIGGRKPVADPQPDGMVLPELNLFPLISQCWKTALLTADMGTADAPQGGGENRDAPPRTGGHRRQGEEIPAAAVPAVSNSASP